MNLFITIFFLFSCHFSSANNFFTASLLNKVEVRGSTHSSLTTKKPYKVQLVTPFLQVKKNSPVPMALWIQLNSNWYTYWSYAGDFGKSLKTNWKLPDKATISPKTFPRPERYSYTLGDKQYSSFIYKKEALIPFELFIDKNFSQKEVKISLDLELFICKDICTSKKENLNLTLKVSNFFVPENFYSNLFEKWKKQQPKEINLKSHFKKKGNHLLIQFQFDENLECLDIFPKSIESFSTENPTLLHQTQNSCSFKVKKTPSSLSFVSGLLSYKQKGKISSSPFNSYEKKTFGLIWFILMAFLGGLLLNIMPCVLPIIFLKFYNTLELAHQSKKEIVKLNLSYVTGVILSFLALAFFVLISKKAGESIGWGFHLQSPLFVTFLSILFICMGFYLLNLFTLPLPKVSINFQNEKRLSHFITGVLSTTAASPCTVPFMASAVGFAFSRSTFEIFMIFFFLGLGLSFPYIILSFFPQWLKAIPAPKKWMNRVKSFLSLPLFLTVFWFIFLIYNQLDFQTFLITVLLFPILILIILLQNFLKKSYFKKVLLSFFMVTIIGILFFQWRFTQSIDKRRQAKTDSQFYDKGLTWKVFSQDKVNKDKEIGHKIFVSIGAEWCLTCKLNERIFYNQEIQQFLKTNNIKLYYGDWTNKNSYITEFLNSYGQSGIPFYVLYNSENQTKILPTLLFKGKTLQTLKSFFNSHFKYKPQNQSKNPPTPIFN